MPPLDDEEFEAWDAIHNLEDRPYTCVLLWAYHSTMEVEEGGNNMVEFCRLLAIDPRSEQADQLWDIAHRAYQFQWRDLGWGALMAMVNEGWMLWRANGFALRRSA